ncbi:MAG: TetR/AcrR family transcriptional regulator [Oscillospiraceae bacterium]
MKQAIIEETIRSLKQEGLRFSVDTLAERLKISKKTVYKYFPTKEALAYAMYEKYYDDLNVKIKEIKQLNEHDTAKKLLLCYFDSSQMVRREIFNKYCLNEAIGNYSLKRHSEVWENIGPYLCSEMTDKEAECCKLIVDGAFGKAIECSADPADVIEMLRRFK